MPRKTLTIVALMMLATLAVAQTAAAETTPAEPMDHSTMDHGTTGMAETTAQTPQVGPDSPATLAFKAAAAAMHRDMAITYTGKPDVDFIRGMIPHHQAAVDAARVELQYGTDPEARAFAETVIAAQEAEIAFMKDWLARNGQ